MSESIQKRILYPAIVSFSSQGIDEILIRKFMKLGFKISWTASTHKKMAYVKDDTIHVVTYSVGEIRNMVVEENYISCGNNMDFFISIIAINHENDYLQWFIDEKTGRMIYSDFHSFKSFWKTTHGINLIEGRWVNPDDFKKAKVYNLGDFFTSERYLPFQTCGFCYNNSLEMTKSRVINDLLKLGLELTSFSLDHDAVIVSNGRVKSISTTGLKSMNTLVAYNYEAFLKIAAINPFSDLNQLFIRYN